MTLAIFLSLAWHVGLILVAGLSFLVGFLLLCEAFDAPRTSRTSTRSSSSFHTIA